MSCFTNCVLVLLCVPVGFEFPWWAWLLAGFGAIILGLIFILCLQRNARKPAAARNEDGAGLYDSDGMTVFDPDIDLAIDDAEMQVIDHRASHSK